MQKGIHCNNSWKEKIFCLFLILLTFFRIFLFLGIPLDALANAQHDDQLLVTQAYAISQGEWLGEYCNNTLVKGITFPLFLAACKCLCLPYGLGLALFYIASILVFLRAVKSLIQNPYAKGILYLFLLYSPAMLSKSTQQRAYNISLVPSLILLVIGCCIGIFLRREDGLRKLLPWSIAEGCSLTAFRFLRDDYMWLFPFVLGAMGITLVCILMQKKSWKKLWPLCVMTILPFFILFGAAMGLTAVNIHYYQAATVNERTNSSFSDVMADLIQMDMPEVREDVWVSRAAMRKAMEYSPTLASIRPSLGKIYKSGWAAGGEIPGDIIAWALRDAVEDAGYYTDGASSEAFYGKVHSELQKAYRDGLCQKKEGLFLSPLSKEFVFKRDFKNLMQRSLDTLKSLLFIERTEMNIFPGTGTAQQIRLFEVMTGSLVVYPDNTEISGDPLLPVSQRPLLYAQRILKVYRAATYLLVLLAAAGYPAMTWSMVMDLKKKQYETWYCWLITTGVIGSCAVLITEVGWFTTFLGEAVSSMYHYCTGALTLIQLVQVFTIGWGIEFLGKKGVRLPFLQKR